MGQRKMSRLYALYKKNGRGWKRVSTSAFTLPVAKAILRPTKGQSLRPLN